MKKVLIVDDETYVRKLVVASLRKQEFEILQAVTAAEAVRLAHGEHPDLIVMDVVLPGRDTDGLQITRDLKSDPDTAHCKILLISGVVNLNESTIIDTGADGYLEKPFNPIKLRNHITRLLGNESQSQGDIAQV